MEYLATDIQVNRVLHYLTSENFKTNLVWFETSNAFHEVSCAILQFIETVFKHRAFECVYTLHLTNTGYITLPFISNPL